MAKFDDWKEGARVGDPKDVCPGCFFVGPPTWDFKKFGEHRMVFCGHCNEVHVDGDKAASVTVHKEA